MLRVRLVGGLAVTVDGGEAEVPGGGRAVSLLAWLALHPGEHRRSELAARFWPDILDTSARASLRTALWTLRRALGENANGYLRATRETVELAGPPEVWVDARAFHDLADAGRLEEALRLGRGELLAGIEDEWVVAARDEHRERVATLLGRMASRVEEAGGLKEAVAHTRAQLALEPLDEASGRELMRRLAEAGDAAGALGEYEQLGERLRDELGLAVSAETSELADRIRGSRAEALAPPSLPPRLPAGGPALAGRSEELVRLERSWRQALGGGRALALLAGEPGIGKTRLAAELAARHAEDATVLYGRCFEETLTPCQSFAEALGQYVSACDPAAVAAQLGPHGRALARLLPSVGARLSLRAGAGGEDPQSERYRAFEAVDALLRAAGRERPVLLVLDDLHWADRPSLLLLLHLVRHPEPFPMLVLGTYRDAGLRPADPLADALAELRREEAGERVVLGGLAEEDVGRLAAGAAGAEPAPALRRALWAQSEGNPFFVRELVHHLADSDALSERDGMLVASRSIDRVGVPEGVREVVGRRVSHLSGAARELLAAAAVAGPEFEPGVVGRAVGQSGKGLVAALEEAEAERLIEEIPGPRIRYSFAHALVRDSLYSGLSAPRRADLHRRLGQALEHDAPDGGESSELAHHFFEAKDDALLGKAAGYAVAAGERASAKLAYERAADHFRNAADALARAGDSASRCRVLLRLGESLWSAGEFAASRDAFREAAEVASESGLDDELAEAALGLGGRPGFELVVHNPALIGLLERALGRLGGGDSALRARLTVRLAEALMFSPQRDRAAELARDSVAMARRLDDGLVLAEVLNNANWILWTPDNLDERVERAREILSLAEAAGATRLRMEAHTWLGASLLERGDSDGAGRELDACVALAQQVRQPYHLWAAEAVTAMRAMFTRPVAECEPLVWRALETGRTGRIPAAAHLFGTQIFHLRLAQRRAGEVRGAAEGYADAFPGVPALRCGLALAYCELGQGAAARRELDRALEGGAAALPRDFVWLSAIDLLASVCAHLGEAGRAAELYDLLAPYADRQIVASAFAVPRGSAERVLGVLAATAGRHDQAIGHLERAEERDAQLGPAPVLAETRFELARALLARDRSEDRARAVGLLTEVAAAAESLGLERLLRLARKPGARDGEPRGREPARVRLRERATAAGDDARAAISRRGRAALASVTGELSDERLDRAFGSDRGQRLLLEAMARAFQPRLALGFEGEIQLELTRDGEGTNEPMVWTVTITGRRASVSRGTAREPAVTMRAPVPEFVRVFSGVANPVLGWVEGRIEVEGDVLLATRMIEMFGGVDPAQVMARAERTGAEGASVPA